ncbi:MAG: NRAMP family divalent metal transporter [Candidatus Limnocylindrales bacterium]
MQKSDLSTQVSALIQPAGAVEGGRLSGLLRVIGPAWIVMLADVDAPSVITAGRAGTAFGYALLFPLLLLIPVLYLVQEMTARLGIVTGRGHAELIRDRYGRRWAALAVFSMAAIDLLAYVAEFAGIALGATILGIPVPLAVVATLLVHTAVVLTGSYQGFERLALVLSLSLFAFVVLAVGQHPSAVGILRGLSPLPLLGPPGSFGVAVALVGASVMPWMLFYQQTATVDKGLRIEDLPAARRETLLGAIVSQGLMAAIVIAAAAAMAAAGGPRIPAGLGELPEGFARLAQGIPAVVVAVGLVASGLLALVVISLSAAWAWSELLGWPHSLNLSLRRAPGFYAVYLLEVVPAALLVLLAPHLESLVIGAMVLNVIVLAIPLTFLVVLSSDRTLLGPLANSPRRAGVLWVVTAGLLVAGLAAVAQSFGL